MFCGWIHEQTGQNTEVLSFNYKEDHHWNIDFLCPSLREWHLPSPILRRKLGCYGNDFFSFAPHNQPAFPILPSDFSLGKHSLPHNSAITTFAQALPNLFCISTSPPNHALSLQSVPTSSKPLSTLGTEWFLKSKNLIRLLLPPYSLTPPAASCKDGPWYTIDLEPKHLSVTSSALTDVLLPASPALPGQSAAHPPWVQVTCSKSLGSLLPYAIVQAFSSAWNAPLSLFPSTFFGTQPWHHSHLACFPWLPLASLRTGCPFF